MPFKIVRNDITKMNTEAIVNTANENPVVGAGCDSAVYQAAGFEELLAYRKERIGNVPAGEAFVTPGFRLPAKYIIHAVSPFFNGEEKDEELLRACYRNSLRLAKEHGIRSIAFPLISTGSFGYPKEEGMRIAADEINAFLLENEMLIYLVVFDEKATALGKKIYPDLEAYIDRHYVEEKHAAEYGQDFRNAPFAGSYAPYREARNMPAASVQRNYSAAQPAGSQASSEPYAPPKKKRGVSIFRRRRKEAAEPKEAWTASQEQDEMLYEASTAAPLEDTQQIPVEKIEEAVSFADAIEEHESRLEERMQHLADTFSDYLLYLRQDKHMENAEVYKRAIVDKKTFSKIKNNAAYHPQKLTALCLCIGAKLNLDETKDLLARAGYALSPCDKTDIIFSYFIENEIYDMIELDIQLEEHGLPCIIS